MGTRIASSQVAMLKNRPAQAIIVSLAVTLPFWGLSGNEPKMERLTSVIVQADDSASAKEAVLQVGGVVTHELDVI